MNDRIQKVLAGLAEGKITRQEADAYLRATEGVSLASVEAPIAPPVAQPTAPPPLPVLPVQPPKAQPSSPPEILESPPAPPEREHREQAHPPLAMMLIATTSILVLMIIGLVFYDGQLTGFGTFDLNASGVQNTSLPITDAVTSIIASGTLIGEGDATILFETSNGTMLIGTLTSDPGLPRTDRPSYAEGDPVTIEHAPADASYYLDDGATAVTVTPPFAAQEAELLIVVGGESPTTYRLPIRIGEYERETPFEELCVDTCAMSATNGTVVVQTTGDARLDVVLRTQDTAPNRAPELIVPFEPLAIDAPTVIDLGTRFQDPDGDALLYSTGGSDIVQAEITDGVLTLTPTSTGSGTLYIYASDLQELVQADVAITTRVPEEPAVDVPPTETPANTTPPLPANTTLAPLDCSSTNPNLRPIECLQQQPDEYFREQDIYLENLDRARVAKLNELGNLLITGDVIESSGGGPGSRDFRIGLPDRDGNVDVVAWIDTEGNLHLKGRLIEEQASLVPPSGSFSIITSRSIYLAYVDMGTGDMYLRGNLIPYRRSLG